jgi:hypothetical protein
MIQTCDRLVIPCSAAGSLPMTQMLLVRRHTKLGAGNNLTCSVD